MRTHAWCVVLCVALVAVPSFADELRPISPVSRPVEVLPEAKVSDMLSKLPPIWDPWLRDIIDSPDTVWYDHATIIPGYQDSFGDSYYPIGFRPNTIQAGLIDLAVPGGHASLFIRSGEFHFPFGRTGHVDDATNTFVIDFWRLPRQSGSLLPVVYSKYEPTGNTHRIEWMFPEGTVFGEIIFIKDSSAVPHAFEIRTRTRTLTGWTVDVYRPFPTAELFADALTYKREERSHWKNDASITRMISHLRNPSTLVRGELKASHFSAAFPAVTGAVDTLPDLDDPSIITELLHESPLRSSKYSVWKESGSLKAYAASTQAPFSIVPKNYNGAFFEVSDAFCNRCHQDAGRPLKDYYPDVMAYGELWGEDDVISWHPFESKNFVDSSGKVVSFNDDNRRFRQDFVTAGLVEAYNSATHPSSRYQKINHAWKKYRY